MQVNIQTDERHRGICVGRGVVSTLSLAAPVAKYLQVFTKPEALQFPYFGDRTVSIM